jgi:hypothetical protein
VPTVQRWVPLFFLLGAKMLTKLEAVNIVLDAIGETPVSSLTSGLPDAEAAEAKLDEATKNVLAKGWHINTEKNFTLYRNTQNEILIPDTYLKVDTVNKYDSAYDVVVRIQNNKRKLYNVSKQSYKFDKNLVCEVIVNLPFEGLTVELQNYIALHAARKFQESSMGSQALDQFTVRAEAEAWAALLDAEAESEDNNILRESPHVSYATTRFNVLSGR